MFGRWARRASGDEEHALLKAVRGQLTNADDETVRIVTAITGLLGGVAYADRDYGEHEDDAVRRHLGTVGGLGRTGVEAILEMLRHHLVEISTVEAPRYCRTLVALGDRDLRLHVLSMLVDIAAADGTLSLDEVSLLRNTATALGLDQADYNALQTEHRDKLALLR